jgi:hypothetical protein
VEILLNLVWAALSCALVWQWLRSNGGHGSNRRAQMIAMIVLIAILFPVISVTDDLMFAQNPAETDNCQRRDHLVSGCLHCLLSGAATEPPPILTGVGFGFLGYVSPGRPAPRVIEHPALAAIENRPPPAA